MAHQTTVLPNGEEAGILAEAIVETIGQPLVILTGDLKIQSANRAFYKTFRVEPAGTEGQMIYDLGNRQWDIPDLRRLLSELLPGNEFFEDFEVEHDFPGSGRGASCCSTRAGSTTCSSSCWRSRTSPSAGGRSRNGRCWWAS